MTLGVLREFHRSQLVAVGWAENVAAIVKTPEAEEALKQARKTLAAIELLLVKEGANVDG